jgi:hypothetical protein
MSFKNLVLALISASAIFLIGCGNTAPVMNVEGSPIATMDGKKPALDKVKKAIVVAGTKLGWQMQPVADGQIVATLFNRGHMAKLDIKYSAETYSLTYKDSSNLKYDGTNIHRNYNKWIDNLDRNIRAELSRI